MFELLIEEYKEIDPDVLSLLGLGSYGLHVLHSANKTDQSTTSWKLQKVFKKNYFSIFKKSPIRQAAYLFESPKSMETSYLLW